VAEILIHQAPRQTTTFGFDDLPPIQLYQLATKVHADGSREVALKLYKSGSLTPST
jgi:hypothetical protein